MQKNSLLKNKETIFRILEQRNSQVLIIDCTKLTMPRWVDMSLLAACSPCTERELLERTNRTLLATDTPDAESKRRAYERYTLIAGVLPFLSDEKERCYAIAKIAEQHGISKQTIKNVLCLYLAYQNISILSPKKRNHERPLTEDEKIMRWALNKFFYTKNKNSLHTAYMLMLKEKYHDSNGLLLPNYPTIHQFRYFYRKHKNM